MQWPDHFPTGCPPENAEPAVGDFLRLTDKLQPKERDFRSYFLIKVDQEWDDPCQACGLSIYTNIEDISRLKRRVPGARSKWVARGNLVAVDGLVLNTPSKEVSHHSWWIPTGEEPWRKFFPLLKPDGTSV